MLSPEKLAELTAFVKEKYPNFRPESFGSAMRGTISIRHPAQFGFAGSMTSLPSCCGVIQIGGVLEMGSILPLLANLTKMQKAIFALWLHHPRGIDAMAGIIATTPSEGHNHNQTETEKVLMEVGFTPISRANNGNYGATGNFITTWFFQPGEATPIPGLTPPEEKPKPALTKSAVLTKKKVLRRKEIHRGLI